MHIHPITDEQLVSYAGESLPLLESSIVAAHVAGCPQCTRTVERFQAIRSVLRFDDSEAPSDRARGLAYSVFHSPAIVARPRPRENRVIGWLQLPRFSVGVAIALLVAIGLFFGMNQLLEASNAAVPGDSLYAVKTTLENVQVQLTIDDTSKAQLQIELANRRVFEMSTLADQGRFSNIPETAQAYESHVQQATDILNTSDQQKATNTAIVAQHANEALQQYTGVLSNLTKSTPPEIKPALDRAIGVSLAEQNVVQQRILGTPSAAPTVVPQPVATATTVPPTLIAPILVAPTATSSPVPPSLAPTDLPPVVSTIPPIPSTSTPGPIVAPPQATSTPAPATDTLMPPAHTPIPPTVTSPHSTATSVPPADTPIPSTSTLFPPTATHVPPSATPVPTFTPPVAAVALPAPTQTAIAPSLTPIPPTPFSATATNAPIAPTPGSTYPPSPTMPSSVQTPTIPASPATTP